MEISVPVPIYSRCSAFERNVLDSEASTNKNKL